MRPYLVPAGALTQVVFIHDYFQLVFDGGRIGIYNRSSLEAGGQRRRTGEDGFADGLVHLIGQRVLHAELEPTLSLQFDRGYNLVVLNGAGDAKGPEAFEISHDGGGMTVSQNAA
ncbi:MAG: hypothetical protein K0S57_3524 [Ramlibacter sp.]|jgi:hypothetical protein|nr:hypothetical protein [Ramlibacter sp.]